MIGFNASRWKILAFIAISLLPHILYNSFDLRITSKIKMFLKENWDFSLKVGSDHRKWSIYEFFSISPFVHTNISAGMCHCLMQYWLSFPNPCLLLLARSNAHIGWQWGGGEAVHRRKRTHMRTKDHVCTKGREKRQRVTKISLFRTLCTNLLNDNDVKTIIQSCRGISVTFSLDFFSKKFSLLREITVH